MNKGFVNITMISPKLKVGNPKYNIEEIINSLKNVKSDICLLPELAITSYSCEDLFLYDEIREENELALKRLLDVNPYKGLLVIGGIFSYDSALFNVAYVIKENKIIGIVPKYYLPNYQEFQEPRWFTSGLLAKRIKKVSIFGYDVPFGMIIFKCSNSKYPLGVGIEICEDVWAPISPSNIMSLNGANIFLNLSASNDYLYKDKKRANMVSEASRKNRGAYLYVSSNTSESSTGIVFGSSCIASIYGEEIVNDNVLTFDTKVQEVSIDLGYIDNLRKKDSPYKESLDEFDREYKVVNFELEEDNNKIHVSPYPFRLLDNDIKSANRVLDLQGYALARRLKHIKCNKIILGVSGGLDSTMSLLSAKRCIEILGLDIKDALIPVFLPSNNSSSKTKNNGYLLVEALGLKPLVIDINSQVDELLKSIEHDKKDITYENAQVRVRTTILMELANKYNAIMLGTSDLSEIAMGYSTYNGDSMSMYNINSSLSKTMIQSIIEIIGNNTDNELLKKALLDIVNTPISAELNVNQFTENEIGEYKYIDFILFRLIKRGDSRERIAVLLKDTFNLDDDKIHILLESFFNRFYKQQYKRNASPDGVKVTHVSLDPHLDFKMPSDVDR